MKIVQHNKNIPVASDGAEAARQLEREGELVKAATLYEKIVKQSRYNENAYDRLMIIYRKLKDYNKEASVIKRAIGAFESLHTKARQRPVGKKITTLSKALMKLTGLADKKGNSLYEPEPLGRWRRRKLVVDKRLKK